MLDTQLKNMEFTFTFNRWQHRFTNTKQLICALFTGYWHHGERC